MSSSNFLMIVVLVAFVCIGGELLFDRLTHWHLDEGVGQLRKRVAKGCFIVMIVFFVYGLLMSLYFVYQSIPSAP